MWKQYHQNMFALDAGYSEAQNVRNTKLLRSCMAKTSNVGCFNSIIGMEASIYRHELYLLRTLKGSLF